MTYFLLLLILISCIFQVVVFVIAYFRQTDKLTDAAYGLGFILINAFSLFIKSEVSLYSTISFILIIVWACRLTIYLIIRIRSIGRDTRFDGIRNRKLAFLKFFLLQGFAIVIISLPHLVLTTQSEYQPNQLIAVMGGLLYGIGITLESIADIQKYRFKKANKGWVNVGLWKYSRHPNYFGEMLIWWGLFVYSFGVSRDLWWISIIGPIFITVLLRFVTGIPPLEKRYEKKYADNKDYQTYKTNTRLLLPLP